MSPEIENKSISKPLPWWTWVMPYVLLHAGTEISLLFKYVPGGSTFYLPTSIGIILINWWGPKRVIPAMYINAMLSAPLWDVGPWNMWFVFSIPETMFITLSWFLFSKLRHGKYWIPDVNSLTSFLVWGILIPLGAEILLLEYLYISTGLRPADAFLHTFLRSSLGEFISNFGLTLPVFYYLTPQMQSRGWIMEKARHIRRPFRLMRNRQFEVFGIYLLLLLFSVTIPYSKFWFLYGVFSLFMAIRYGYGLAILTNLYIYVITYNIPLILMRLGQTQVALDDNILNIYLGTSLLFVFAAITGCVITEVSRVEKKIIDQLYQLEMTNKELEVANKELDKFVYSVSHDLTAPLKSIQGLVNISRINTSSDDHELYFNKIESSVKKLETFIHEVLDYSRNNRQAIAIEAVNLPELIREVLDHLRFADGYAATTIVMKELSTTTIFTDKTRLKVILNNLLANALKYQKRTADHKPVITIRSEPTATGILLHIQDNGEGIHPEIREKIFNMFFRGNQSSQGSGLGLYIARESAEKIKGTISVTSIYGEGSVFTVALTDLKEASQSH